MSFKAEELQQHCQTIIASPRIKNKIVILCEGNIHTFKGRPSPSFYRQQEKLPDANFYKACVPIWWQQKRPEFFVCGDRHDVISTYFELQKMHEKVRDDSFLDKNKLFAIIDLDLQLYEFADRYPIKDTEALFHRLYQQGNINQQAVFENSIFITGLIYKEAYFLIPDLQRVFDEYSTPVSYKNAQVNLTEIYREMVRNLIDDKNIQKPLHFLRACERIKHCEQLDFSSLSHLQRSWLNAFDTDSELTQRELIFALLTIHQVKDYWKALAPHHESVISTERFVEQLTLEIAKFYARQARDSVHHIPCLFNALSQRT